jgi:pimeloyl-ACP methyl ester carboxylesterase
MAAAARAANNASRWWKWRYTALWLVTARAREVGDTTLARRLSQPQTDSTPPITESMLFHVRGELYGARSVWKIIWTGLRAPEYTLLDAYHVQRGAQYVGSHMRNDVPDDWLLQDPSVAVPVLFALGRHDCNTPAAAALRFLTRLAAPWKSAQVFDSSAHFPFWEEPVRFGRVLRAADSVAVARSRRATPPSLPGRP